MRFRILLRVASVLSILHAGMHQLGMSQTPTNPAEIAVAQSMRSYQTNVMGSMRSYMDFHTGMGLFLTIMLVGLGVLLWQLSCFEEHSRQKLRPALLTIGLTFLAFTAASTKYFFAAPIIMEALIAVLVLAAYFNARKVA